VPGKPQIDWLGVRALAAAPLLSETRQSARTQADQSTRAAAEASAPGADAVRQSGAGRPMRRQCAVRRRHGPDFEF